VKHTKLRYDKFKELMEIREEKYIDMRRLNIWRKM
jgi:hypothetical protein